MTRQRVRLPNFFILGAGRCGTSSLALALNAHPDVFIPGIKEPSFFASSFQWVKDPARYVSLYEPASAAAAVGDASHIYLEDPESPRILQAFFPDARFVLVFRHPADRALGLYAHMVEGGYELHRTFDQALDAEESRFHSERFRRSCRQSFWNYMYVRSGLFGEQVQRYFEYFEREQFWFTTLDRLVTEPAKTMRDLHRFLDVEPVEVETFPRDATSKGTRSRVVAYAGQRLLRPLARRTGFPGESMQTAITRWNRGRDKPAMQPATRSRLQERFEPDLRLLRELTGIDLTEPAP
ncbi:MAG: sulfotransferase family protein [Actinomycetota bacterium]